MILRGASTRVGGALTAGHRGGWRVPILALVCAPIVAALATWLGMQPIVLGLGLVALLAVNGFRWPFVPLALFAALIPIEEILVIEGVGTLSRVAGIVFAVTYAAPRLNNLSLGVMPPAGWAYVAFAMFSLVWAMDAPTASQQLLTLLQLFVIALLVGDYVVKQPAIVRPLLWIYSLSAAATAAVGILTYLGGGVADARVGAIESQNPAQFAAVLLPALIFALHEVVSGDRRILAGCIVVLATIGIVVSGTRGAWVAAGVGVLLFMVPQLPARRRLPAVAGILILLLAVYQLPGIGDLVAERSGNAVETGGAGRLDIWTVGLHLFSSAPVTGVGFANFPVAYTLDAVRASGVTYAAAIFEGRGPHNLVVGTLIELGAIGLVLLALFLLPLLLRRGFGPDAATVRAMLASLCTLALFLDIFSNRKQVWLVIGLAAGLAYLRQRSDRALASGAPPQSPEEVRHADENPIPIRLGAAGSSDGRA